MIGWFRAETPGEQYRLTHAGDAWRALSDLWDAPNEGLRSILRYRKLETEEAQKLRDEICAMYHATLEAHGIDMERAGEE
jgi:hypothetical protein